VGLALLLLGWQTQPTLGQQDTPLSRGAVATITAIDTKTDMATLQTEAGEVFALPKEWQWHVGHKVLCDWIDAGPLFPRLRNCRPWETQHAGDASLQRERHTSSR
jgi:hypothetical protein